MRTAGEQPIDAGLADRIELADLMTRFATAIDSCDWPAYRSVFTDTIELDYSSWRPEHLGQFPADEWVARATRLFPGLTATRHALTNVLVRLDETTGSARVRANVCADHVLVVDGEPHVFTLNGHYDDRCVRTPEGWRIRDKRLVVEWTVGDRQLLARAAERVASGADDLRQAVR